MAAGFFRKSALEKLSTPEKLDQLIRVTDRRAWIALLTVVLAIVTALLWSVFGKVKTKLDVIGVIQGGEVHEVVSTAQGQLLEVRASIGDHIEKGQVIAVLQQPELQQQILDAEAVLKNQNFEMEKLLSYGSEESLLQSGFIRQTIKSIKGEIIAEEKNIVFLEGQHEAEDKLLKKGLITQSQINETRQQIEASHNSIERLKGQLAETSNQRHNVTFDLQQKTRLQQQRIEEAARNLKFLRERYDIQSNIRSPYNGYVVESLTDVGVMVSSGSPLFKVKNQDEINSQNLTAILYIPSKDGKKLKKGMEALVAPSTIQPQEDGFIVGKVIYVSEFPVTQQGMLISVRNEQLVQGFLSAGPMFEVHVEFEQDSDAFSGFRWTSAQGPEIEIHEGTSCFGKVTVKEERPLALAVPSFKKFFDLY